MAAFLHIVCPACVTVNRVLETRLTEGRCGQCKQPLFTGRPVTVDDSSFDVHFGKSDIPLVVDFWAPWCGPCRTMAPHFERVAAEIEPSARLAKLNTEDCHRSAARFGIRSIPTVVVFRSGREITRQSGAMDYASLSHWIGAAIR